MNDEGLHPCWKCDNLIFWRSRDGVIHCATAHRPGRTTSSPSVCGRSRCRFRSWIGRFGFIGSALKEERSIEARSVDRCRTAGENRFGYPDEGAVAPGASFGQDAPRLVVGPPIPMTPRFAAASVRPDDPILKVDRVGGSRPSSAPSRPRADSSLIYFAAQ